MLVTGPVSLGVHDAVRDTTVVSSQVDWPCGMSAYRLVDCQADES